MTLEIVDNFEEQQKEQTSSALPWVEVPQIPSEFKGYPEGTLISYEPYTIGDLEALNGGMKDDQLPGEQTILRGIADLMKAIKVNTMKTEDLYFWDFMYIGLERKLKALGDGAAITGAICPECGKQHIYEYRFSDLECKDFDVPALPAKTTINGVELHFVPTTIKRFLQSNPKDGIAGTYAGMVSNLPYEEALQIIKTAPAAESKKLRYISDLFTMGWKPFVIECDGEKEVLNPDYDENYKPKKGSQPDEKYTKEFIKVPCKHKIEMEVNTPFEVVFPENIMDNFDESEIRFG